MSMEIGVKSRWCRGELWPKRQHPCTMNGSECPWGPGFESASWSFPNPCLSLYCPIWLKALKISKQVISFWNTIHHCTFYRAMNHCRLRHFISTFMRLIHLSQPFSQLEKHWKTWGPNLLCPVIYQVSCQSFCWQAWICSMRFSTMLSVSLFWQEHFQWRVPNLLCPKLTRFLSFGEPKCNPWAASTDRGGYTGSGRMFAVVRTTST